MGLVRMVRPWNEWLIVWGYDISQPPPELTTRRGDPDRAQPDRRRHGPESTIRLDLAVVQQQDVRDALPAGPRLLHGGRRATVIRRRTGWAPTPRSRTPTTSRGSSPSCCGATPGEGLLDSYDAERAPIGEQIVLRANKSIEEFGPIFEALGLHGHERPRADEASGWRLARTTRPEAARAARRSCARRSSSRTTSSTPTASSWASATGPRPSSPDGTPEPEYTRDPELYYHPTTWPGARLPHCWLGSDGHEISTQDLAGHGRFALLTGISGQAWATGGSPGLRAARYRRSRPT